MTDVRFGPKLFTISNKLCATEVYPKPCYLRVGIKNISPFLRKCCSRNHQREYKTKCFVSHMKTILFDDKNLWFDLSKNPHLTGAQFISVLLNTSFYHSNIQYFIDHLHRRRDL